MIVGSPLPVSAFVCSAGTDFSEKGIKQDTIMHKDMLLQHTQSLDIALCFFGPNDSHMMAI